MPLTMIVNSSDCVKPGQERPDRQRRLGLPHEDASRDVRRLGAARAHDPLHPNRHAADHVLHHAEVVEDGEHCANEDDDRQNLKREDHTERARPSSRAPVQRETCFRPRRSPAARSLQSTRRAEYLPETVFSTRNAKANWRPKTPQQYARLNRLPVCGDQEARRPESRPGPEGP